MLNREDVENALANKYIAAKQELADYDSRPVSLDLSAGMIESATKIGVEERIRMLEEIAEELEQVSGLRFCIGRSLEEIPIISPLTNSLPE
jgi:hypothetical protein